MPDEVTYHIDVTESGGVNVMAGESLEPPEESPQEEAEDLETSVTELVERAVRKDNTIDLKIISPGWGASGYYSPELLKEDGPTAFRAGTQMYLDHPTETEARDRPERSVRDLAAVTISDAVYQESGPTGPGLYARASVLPHYRDVIEALAPHIGVSIRAGGVFRPGEVEGRKGRIIEKIKNAASVDFVTKPGRGGQVLALMESLRASQKEPEAVATSISMTDTANISYVQPVGSSATPAYTITTTGTGPWPVPVSEAQTEEVKNMELTEAQERITALESELEESKTTAQEATDRAQRAEGALVILEAQGEARKLMENIELPAAAKARVVTKVSADPTVTEGKLDIDALKEAVEAESKVEADYIESIVGSGKIHDQGTQSGSQPADEAKVKESLKSGLARFFDLTDDAATRASEVR